jgi:hypothetical protein
MRMEKPAAFQVEPGVRQLFLDDVGVERIDGQKPRELTG